MELKLFQTYNASCYYRAQIYGFMQEYDLMLADLREYERLAGEDVAPRVTELLDAHPISARETP